MTPGECGLQFLIRFIFGPRDVEPVYLAIDDSGNMSLGDDPSHFDSAPDAMDVAHAIYMFLEGGARLEPAARTIMNQYLEQHKSYRNDEMDMTIEVLMVQSLVLESINKKKLSLEQDIPLDKTTSY